MSEQFKTELKSNGQWMIYRLMGGKNHVGDYNKSFFVKGPAMFETIRNYGGRSVGKCNHPHHYYIYFSNRENAQRYIEDQLDPQYLMEQMAGVK